MVAKIRRSWLLHTYNSIAMHNKPVTQDFSLGTLSRALSALK
jgi:hypothetical protein